MKQCYENTSKALGNDFEIDWKTNYSEALKAINGNLEQYSVGIFDVNLDYNPRLPLNQQTTEGLDLIKLAKEKSKEKGMDFPIICASSNNSYRKSAMQNGADLFLLKKEFWNKGKSKLENIIKKI